MDNNQGPKTTPVLTVHSGQSGDLDQASLRLPLAFDIGELLNQWVWHLEQSLSFFDNRHKQSVIDVLSNLAGKVIQLAPTLDAGLRLHSAVLRCREDCQNVCGSEWLAEEVSETIHNLENQLTYDSSDLSSPAPPEDAFEGLTSQSRQLQEIIRGLSLGTPFLALPVDN